MSDKPQHAKAREWWLKPTATQQLTVYYQQPTDVGIPSIKVREVLPGEITITREELNNAWTKVKGDFMHPDCADLEEELFGDLLPEGSHE